MKKIIRIFLSVILLLSFSSCSLPGGNFNSLNKNSSDTLSFNVINELEEVTSLAHIRITQVEDNFFESQDVSLGSGVIISEDQNYYYALTNNHVIYTEKRNVSYRITDAYMNSYTGTVLKNDKNYDLAYIKFSKNTKYSLKVLELATSVKANDICIALGEPLGQSRVFTVGRIIGSEVFTPIDTVDALKKSNVTFSVYKHSAEINNGSSGGALINTDLKLVGINFASKVKEDTNEFVASFAIPVDKAIEFINKSYSTSI